MTGAADAAARVDGGAWPALILAGRRPKGDSGGDPLAAAAGVAEKCLVPVAGVPMLRRVLCTLAATPAVGAITVALADEGVLAACAPPPALAGRLAAAPCAASPSLTVLAVAEALSWPAPLLLTTADHPLLTSAMVEHLIAAGAAADADLAVAVCAMGPLGPGVPQSRRTLYRFRDGRFGGCNLFAVLTPAGYGAFRLWARLERERKRPWRIVRAFGLGPLLAYLCGRLSLDQAFARASAVAGVRAVPVILPWPEAAVDVDTPADLKVAEAVLWRRTSAAEGRR